MISMKEIAVRSGVSRTTASFVLSGRYLRDVKISPEVVEKVLGAASELGYVRNELAISIQGGKSRVVAFMCSFYPDMLPILQGYSESAAESDYLVKMVPFGEDINQTLLKLAGYRVDGITAVELPDEVKSQIDPSFFRYGIAQEGLDKSSWSLSFDQTATTELGIEYLLSLGHRRIVCLSGATRIAGKRLCGYRNVMLRHGLEPISLEFTEDVIPALLEYKPDAVFCWNDHHALELNQKLYRMNLYVPEVFSLMGFSDVYAAQVSTPSLTSLSECGYESGRRAFESILYQIRHGHAMENPPAPLIGQVIVRESTAKKHRR